VARIKIFYPEKTIYEHNVRVRIGDLSSSGHLAFDSLVGILNDASAEFFLANGIVRGNRNGQGVIYTELAVNDLNEAYYGDMLQIEIAVSDVGSKGFDLFFRVNSAEKEKVVAVAKIGVLFFDYQKGRAVKMPAQFRARIQPVRQTTRGRRNL